MILLMAIVGACLYRWRGHASKYKKFFPRPFNQIAFALPYAFIALQVSWYAGLIVLAATVLALLTGHGNFFLRGTGGKPETTEFLVSWAKPYMSLYWYRVMGLSMTGLLVTLPCGIATLNPVIALSGILKGAAYVISNKLKYGDTEKAEFFTGLFLWGVLGFYI